MPKEFINTHKLATLPELRYLLLDVLNNKEPVEWLQLNTICKERSLNFAFAFDNTLVFLELGGIIKINDDKSVMRNEEENYSALTSDYLFNLFLLDKLFVYLEAAGILKTVINQSIIKTNASNGALLIHIDKIPPGFAFIKVFLLNLQIAEPFKNNAEPLVIAQPYKKIFLDKLQESTSVKKETVAGETVTKDPEIKKKPVVFISYASEDEDHKIALQKHFSGLVDNNTIECWDGQAILPGADWDEEIRKKLDEAQIVLFLMSSDFMDSNYIKNVEMQKTIERHNKKQVKIIPVLVRPCDYQSLPIGKFQVLPSRAKPISKWSSRDEAYLNVVENIKKIL